MAMKPGDAHAPSTPVSGVPVQAYPPPVSAVPVSAYPTTGHPGYFGYPVPQPKVPYRKGPWLWMVVGVCALLTVGVGVLGYLVFSENTSSRQVIAEQDAEIADLESRIRQRESDNGAIRDTTEDYQTSLTAQETLLADLQQCPDAVQAYIDAAVSGTDAEFNEAAEHMIEVCHL
jgi:hypothetical protein